MAENDFTQGSTVRIIMRLAIPMTLAQLINVLYSVVDRIYIGRMPQDATLSMTALGISLPIISAVIAFANLVGMGGAPLCSIARGRGDIAEAEKIMGNSFTLMMIVGAALTAAVLFFKQPLLYAFGASRATFPFADAYLTIYISGSLFVMCGLGLNNFINSQGFGRVGMLTVLIGALCNIALDPLFIFVFHMGVQGAALATIISQCVSAVWILLFLTGKTTILRLRPRYFRLAASRVKAILSLGLSGFTMSITNSAIQIVINSSLRNYGGDLYVGAMTIISSVREVLFMPMHSISQAAQPVMGYNYGAGAYARVRQAIRFTVLASVGYTAAAWMLVFFFPTAVISVFSDDPSLISVAVPSMHIYFFGFFLISMQYSGQSVFVALGKSKQAIFFSIFRKIIVVIPLTLLLPRMFSLGTTGVFLAEPISNLLGGCVCFFTMMMTVWPEMKRLEHK